MAKTETKLPIHATKTATQKPAAPATSTFDGLRKEIDRLFDDFGSLHWRSPFGRTAGLFDIDWPRRESWQVAPAMDLVEKDGTYEISAELPGMDEKDVEVKLADGVLTIRGEKQEEKEEHDKEYHLSERRYGSFQRSFRIPESVDIDRIEANFAKGVLNVTLPKTAQAQKSAKKIDVKGG